MVRGVGRRSTDFSGTRPEWRAPRLIAWLATPVEGGRVSRSMCCSHPLTGGFRYSVLVCCIEWGACSPYRRGDVSRWRRSEAGRTGAWLCYNVCCSYIKSEPGIIAIGGNGGIFATAYLPFTFAPHLPPSERGDGAWRSKRLRRWRVGDGAAGVVGCTGVWKPVFYEGASGEAAGGFLCGRGCFGGVEGDFGRIPRLRKTTLIHIALTFANSKRFRCKSSYSCEKRQP